ncbi:hypothetical protein [Reinekea marinisedimentorum]|uniref:Uncharacterized protein n=1 Tax=Reinekea marinisedimentorum TaxID=230495 RepID=A0A4R3HVB7_9GAMM|nr:hypothetical protein [Reinekea marinisedimentorum]TCS34400.1 hypothetical protein BCF53_1434 [Reinekea marinisedimentorum]
MIKKLVQLLPEDFSKSQCIKNAYSVEKGVLELGISINKLKHPTSEYNGCYFIELYICISPLYSPSYIKSKGKEVALWGTVLGSEVVEMSSELSGRSFWSESQLSDLQQTINQVVEPWFKVAGNPEYLIQFYQAVIHSPDSKHYLEVESALGNFLAQKSNVPVHKRNQFYKNLSVLYENMGAYSDAHLSIEKYKEYVHASSAKTALKRILDENEQILELIDQGVSRLTKLKG